jgi:hypothetical protein
MGFTKDQVTWIAVQFNNAIQPAPGLRHVPQPGFHSRNERRPSTSATADAVAEWSRKSGSPAKSIADLDMVSALRSGRRA